MSHFPQLTSLLPLCPGSGQQLSHRRRPRGEGVSVCPCRAAGAATCTAAQSRWRGPEGYGGLWFSVGGRKRRVMCFGVPLPTQKADMRFPGALTSLSLLGGKEHVPGVLAVWRAGLVERCCISYETHSFTVFYSSSVYKKKLKTWKYFCLPVGLVLQ